MAISNEMCDYSRRISATTNENASVVLERRLN
jgi:hypothetical protein